MAITRACYANREQVRRALDVQQSAYADTILDRKLQAASGAVDRLCMRKFYPLTTTYNWDWPNYQYAYPWRLWLDQRELAGPPTLVESGPFLNTPIIIPPSEYILLPQSGPPYTSIQLRRDTNAAFGNNTTPQYDIQITGPFGYWLQTEQVANLSTAISSASQTTVSLTANGLVDVGNTLVIGSERMLVTDSQYVSTGISPTAGCTTSSAADNTLTVPDGTQFATQEVILLDSEWMLIQSIIGNNLIVKRAYSGSVLATHSLPPIYARRQLTVSRAFLGTAAATYLAATPVSIDVYPDLVTELTIAEAVVGLIQGSTGYANTQQVTWYGQVQRNQGQVPENFPGPGLPDLRQQCFDAYGRKARSRVVLWDSTSTSSSTPRGRCSTGAGRAFSIVTSKWFWITCRTSRSTESRYTCQRSTCTSETTVVTRFTTRCRPTPATMCRPFTSAEKRPTRISCWTAATRRSSTAPGSRGSHRATSTSGPAASGAA